MLTNINSITKSESVNLLVIYRFSTFIIVPVLVLFLILEKQLNLDFNFYQKSLLIYCAFTLTILQILGLIELFRQWFNYAHYFFQSGVIVLVLLWFYDSPGAVESASLILASVLLSASMIHPKPTIIFGTGLLISFIVIGVLINQVHLEIGLILFTSHVVLSIVNYWQYSTIKKVKTAHKVYKHLFDSTSEKVFVLDINLKIIKLNQFAEKYFYDNKIENYFGESFHKLIGLIEHDVFFKAVDKCNLIGDAKIIVNCQLANEKDPIPNEFSIRKTLYYEHEVFIVTNRIIKEQKDFEEKLLRQRQHVDQILNSIDSFVYNINYNCSRLGKYEVNFVSQKIEKIYGCNVDEYKALIKNNSINKNIHPEDKALIKNRFDELIKHGGGQDSWRFRMLIKDEYRWIEESIRIQKDFENDCFSVFGIVKDVTKEVNSQHLLEESEHKYKELFESNLAGVYKTHFDGRILDCNLSFAQMLGYDEVKELIGTQVQDLYYEQTDRRKYIDLLKVKKGLNNYLLILKRKDGRRLILNNNVSVLKEKSDQFNIIVGTVVDVTSLHETGLALQYSEEKYRLLFEESGNAILLLLIDGSDSVIVDVNSKGSDLFSSDIHGLQGKTIFDISELSNKLDRNIKEVIEELISNGKAEREWVFKNNKNETFYAEASFVFVNLDEEKFMQVVIKDISERKQYEKEILESRLSFKNVVDQSPASIFIFIDELLTYVNPKGEQLYLEVMKSKGKKLYTIFPKETHFLIKDMIVEANNDISSYTEIDLGQEKRFSINVVKTNYNQKKAHIFILNDISLQNEYNTQKLRAEIAEDANMSLQEEIKKHKKTQQSLFESTARLTALFDSASNLYIVSIDKKARVTSFNNELKKGLKNLLEHEIKIGDNFIDIFPQEDYAKEVLIKRFNRAIKGETLEMVANFPDKKGNQLWIQCFMNPIVVEDEPIKEISFIAHDITEQVLNRKKTIESEESNRAIILAVPDILFRVNKRGILTDLKISGESNQKVFNVLTNTHQVIGEKITDIIANKKIGSEIKVNVLKALEKDQLITHNITLYLDKGDESTKIYYENRYAKMNDDEVVIMARNVTDTIEYESKLIESVKEKEVLLKEVHHRVKNNLQVINSILNLQSSYIKDEETLQIIIESQNRIRSMSYIHESLYQTKDFSSISFDNYISNLVQNLVHSYEIHAKKTKLTLKVDKVELPLDQAIPCGLILNELITNSLKYAYPKKEQGEIKIEVKEIENKVNMSVQDFGCGLPKNFRIDDSDTLGLSLVDTLIDQLDGELILKRENGTEFLIIFEKQEV